MRLIDADALFNWGKHKLSDAVKYGNKDVEHQNFSYSTLMMYEIADEVDEAPTIDAVPVVRGEWEVAIGYDPNKKVQCQNCYKMAYEPTPYCPNCGSYNGGDKA